MEEAWGMASVAAPGAAVALGAIGIVGCGSTQVVRTTDTRTVKSSNTVTQTKTKVRVKLHIKRGPPITQTEITTHTITASSPAFAPSSHGQSFSGEGSENLGPIHVHKNSELYGSCPSCASDNFTIGNNLNDDSQIGVNELGPTSGNSFIDAGIYRDVEVDPEGGDWTITVNPG